VGHCLSILPDQTIFLIINLAEFVTVAVVYRPKLYRFRLRHRQVLRNQVLFLRPQILA
jgi:hypothetical protein